MSDYKLQTIGGHSFYEVASAFQKYIRRGMEHEAMYWGTELFMSNYEEYVWFRMRVICSEDVGLAEPELPAQINGLYQTYLDFKKKKNKHAPEKLPFVHALMLLVRAKKSRLVDNKLCYYFDLRNEIPTPPFDDFVYCMHTIQGKMKKRGNDHFYEEAALINNGSLRLAEEEYQVRDFVWNLYKNRDASKIKPILNEEPQQEKLF